MPVVNKVVSIVANVGTHRFDETPRNGAVRSGIIELLLTIAAFIGEMGAAHTCSFDPTVITLGRAAVSIREPTASPGSIEGVQTGSSVGLNRPIQALERDRGPRLLIRTLFHRRNIDRSGSGHQSLTRT